LLTITCDVLVVGGFVLAAVGQQATVAGSVVSIDVRDERGQNLTKETLVDIAFSTSGLPESQSARARLMGEDDFRLHQMIEDDEVTEFLSR
jgi:hypothetical protein